MSNLSIQQTEFTPRQVAKMLGLGKQTVLDYIHRGELAAWNAANDSSRARFRISIESIDRFKKLRSVLHPLSSRRTVAPRVD